MIDAYGELVDEGCLGVFGPNISENTIPLRTEIERRFQVPAISLCGADDWLGEWTFGLPNGSMTDEPIMLAHLIARAGLESAGVLVERSLIGQLYLRSFRDACRDEGIRLVAEETIAQTGQDIEDAVRSIHASKPDALVHLGFGFGVIRINEALSRARLGPASVHGDVVRGRVLQRRDLGRVRRAGSASSSTTRGTSVGQRFLDRFEAVYGRRPRVLRAGGVPRRRDVVPPGVRQCRAALSPWRHGSARASEDGPRGFGSPGTRISFGKWTRRGWMGAGYLTARSFNPDRATHQLAARYESDLTLDPRTRRVRCSSSHQIHSLDGFDAEEFEATLRERLGPGAGARAGDAARVVCAFDAGRDLVPEIVTLTAVADGEALERFGTRVRERRPRVRRAGISASLRSGVTNARDGAARVQSARRRDRRPPARARPTARRDVPARLRAAAHRDASARTRRRCKRCTWRSPTSELLQIVIWAGLETVAGGGSVPESLNISHVRDAQTR